MFINTYECPGCGYAWSDTWPCQGDVPVFPTGLTDMGHVLRIMADLPCNGDQAGAQALVDEKSHDAGMLSIRRRTRCTGF